MLKCLSFVMTLMVMCMGVQASSTEWQWTFNHSAQFGTSSWASDGVDNSDIKITGTHSYYVGVYHEQDEGEWSDDSGFYSTDMRAPLQLKPGESKTWVFYLWADPSYPQGPSGDHLELDWGWYQPSPDFSNMNYVLTYVAPAQGVTNGPTVGKSVLLNENPQGTWRLPVYRTEDGRTGYVFSLTATVIPEPSSLLALLAGVAGIGGVVWRRKLR